MNVVRGFRSRDPGGTKVPGLSPTTLAEIKKRTQARACLRKKEEKRAMSKRGKGEGTIYQRNDGRWVAELTLEDGKRKYFYAKTQEDVIQKLQQAQFEMKQGVLATGPKQKLGTFIEQWFEDAHKPRLRTSTYIRYRGLLNKHILPALGKMPLQKVTAQHIQAFYSGKLKEGQSASSVRNMHNVLSSALKDAVKWRLISYNPCEGVSIPRETKRKAQALSIEQAQYLLTAIKGDHLEAFIVLALITGMRHGELTALRWEDIDLNNGTVYVHRTVSHRGRYKFIEGDPKTASGERRIDIPSEVCRVLEAHQIRQAEIKIKAGPQWQERDLVFCSKTGNFLSAAHLLDRFYRLLKKVGLPKMRIHDLRHSAASIMIAMGVNLKMIQEILGHSSFSTTMNIYSHVLPSMKKDAMERMKNLFQDTTD